MPSKKKAALASIAGGGDSSMFGLTLKQLTSLMELRGKDMNEKLNSSEYNGINGILDKLKVDANRGLNASDEKDIEQRQTAYGRNEIPQKPMTSFLKFCWIALHDPILCILLACAIVSIALSFHKPPNPSEKNPSGDRKLILSFNT